MMKCLILSMSLGLSLLLLACDNVEDGKMPKIDADEIQHEATLAHNQIG